MKKMLVALTLILGFSYLGSNEVSADFGNMDSKIDLSFGTPLTDAEIQYLIENVGMTEYEINSTYDKDFLRELIEIKAVKSFFVKDTVRLPEANVAQNADGIAPLINGELDGYVNITGSAYRVTSDRSDYTYKYLINGQWDWAKNMIAEFTDAFAIGFQNAGAGIHIPHDSAGNIIDHMSYYRTGPTIRQSILRPHSAEPGAGVGVKFNILQGYGNLHNGSTRLYIYSKQSLQGSNVRFQYGHSELSITPNFSVGNGGLSIGFSPNYGGTTGYILKSFEN